MSKNCLPYSPAKENNVKLVDDAMDLKQVVTFLVHSGHVEVIASN